MASGMALGHIQSDETDHDSDPRLACIYTAASPTSGVCVFCGPQIHNSKSPSVTVSNSVDVCLSTLTNRMRLGYHVDISFSCRLPNA